MEAFPTSDERTPTLAEDPALGLSQRAKLEILFAVMLGLFLGALDQTIVGPALPTIVTQLSGNDYYVWAVTIYLLTSTITVPFWGKLSDIYGRKPIFMIGIVIFLVGSALSGLSQNMGMLILFRGIQGIGAGSLFPVALAVIGDLFTPAERGKYQGLFGAVFGVAFVAGPLVGGWLTENVGWHWIFYVNIPIGIAALLVIQRLLPVVRTPAATRNFDILGGLIFTVAISFLLVGLTNKQFGDWTDPTVGGFILVGVIGSILFALVERRAKEAHHHVADELVHDPVLAVDRLGGGAPEPGQLLAELARGQLLGEGGGAADVGEQHAQPDLGPASALLQLFEAQAADGRVLVPRPSVDHPHDRRPRPGERCRAQLAARRARDHPEPVAAEGEPRVRIVEDLLPHRVGDVAGGAVVRDVLVRPIRGVAHRLRPARPPRASRCGWRSP